MKEKKMNRNMGMKPLSLVDYCVDISQPFLDVLLMAQAAVLIAQAVVLIAQAVVLIA